MKTWKDHLKETIMLALGIGGVFFWVIVIMVYAQPVFAGKVASVFGSFILNNLAGYQVDDYLRGVAVEQVAECNGNFHCSVVNLLDYVHSNLTYVPDTLAEMYRSPEEILESGAGDCTGFSTLYVGLARQVGIQSRVVLEIKERQAGHAYVVVESEWGDVYNIDPTAGTYEVVG